VRPFDVDARERRAVVAAVVAGGKICRAVIENVVTFKPARKGGNVFQLSDHVVRRSVTEQRPAALLRTNERAHFGTGRSQRRDEIAAEKTRGPGDERPLCCHYVILTYDVRI
jgi:hypothetical protein